MDKYQYKVKTYHGDEYGWSSTEKLDIDTTEEALDILDKLFGDQDIHGFNFITNDPYFKDKFYATYKEGELSKPRSRRRQRK